MLERVRGRLLRDAEEVVFGEGGQAARLAAHLLRRERIPAGASVCRAQRASAEGRSSPDGETARVFKEETDNSQIMRTLHFFTDVYGPRLTGSPSLKAAGEWAVKQMQQWGFENAHLEPWNFGHPGWVNERASGFIVSPVKDSLVFEVLAWTPSTNGAAVAPAVQIVLPERPTQEQLTAYFDSVRDKVKGRIVLVGKHTIIPVQITPPPKRLADEDLRPRFPREAMPTPTPAPSPSPTPAATPGRP